jgi:hypothetical protein
MKASVHGESFGVSPSFDTESQDEVQDKSVQDESVTKTGQNGSLGVSLLIKS